MTGRHAIVPYEDEKTKKSAVLLADVRTGRTATTPPVPATDPGGHYESVTAAGGQVYAVTRQVSRAMNSDGYTTLLPGGLDVIDPATATIQRRPLPFAVETYKSIGIDSIVWLGAAGGRLYVAGVTDHKETVTAYATAGPGSPAELGGVPVSDWPDACTVAPGYAVNKNSYNPRDDDVFVGSIPIRRFHCVYEQGQPLDVAIVWVAGTPAEAQSLLDVHRSDRSLYVQTLRLPGVDAAYSLNHELWIRTGRYIVRFHGDDPDRRKLAQVVAKTLRSS